MHFKTLYTVFLVLIASAAIAGNPAIRGNWKGYIISNTQDPDNRNGLPTTLYIIDDNDEGYIVGEMLVQYRYQSDIYKAKYKIEGIIDYQNYTMSIQQTGMVFYDLLPKGLQWCFGSGNFNIYRSIYGKKNYLDGYLATDCGPESLRMILIKM